MEFITDPAAIADWSARARLGNHRVGFVPTMGALHEGHLDLVHRARAVCDRVVCSIFVNPLQFNNPEDLERYPRRPEGDRRMLKTAGCDALFSPVKEALFEGFVPALYDLQGLDDHWEGPSRPGHFQGVMNVVERLFFHVRPDAAFFGEKDRQQLAIIRAVAAHYRWPEEIVGCPTVRAADGLALSSRNLRLSAAERTSATVIHKALRAAQDAAFHASIEETRSAALGILAAEPALTLDYFGLADAITLQPLGGWDGVDEAVALIAAQVGPVRLIDNVTLHRT
ncbi:MAG: pantoate--beta-alanine ligase [Flavobacteriales bacterium]